MWWKAKNLTRQRHSIHGKTHLHKSHILEEPLRNPYLFGVGMKHVFLFLQPLLYQGMICPPSSPGKKALNFNTDNSSNSLLDQWKEFHSFSFYSHHSLLVNFSAKGEMNWTSKSQSMDPWALSSLRQSVVKRGSVDLEVCEILSSGSLSWVPPCTLA